MVPGEAICTPLYNLEDHQHGARLACSVLQACVLCAPLHDHECSPKQEARTILLANPRYIPFCANRFCQLFAQATYCFLVSKLLIVYWQVGYHMCTSVAGAALLGLPFAMGLLGEQ